MELADMRDLGSRAERRAGSTPVTRTTSSQASYRLRRFFMLCIKSHLALTPLLLLSKSNPLRWASIWFFSTIINILHQCYTSHTIPPSKTFPSHILTGLYFFYRMYYHFHIRGFYALWLCGAFGKIPVFNDRLIKRDKTNEKSNCSAVVYMHNISGMCRRGKSI